MFEGLNETFGKIQPEYKSNSGINSVEGFAWGIANLMIGVGISVALITLVYAFIQFTMTLGDPKKMRDAKYAALLSAVAFCVSLLGYGIKNALFKTVGL